jgi:hypothetical protein
MLLLGAIVLGALGYGLWHALLFFNQQKNGPQEGDDKPSDLSAKGAIGIRADLPVLIACMSPAAAFSMWTRAISRTIDGGETFLHRRFRGRFDA